MLNKTTIEKHHHGHVFVNSQPNQGATFGFSLPIVDYEEDDLEENVEEDNIGKDNLEKDNIEEDNIEDDVDKEDE